MCFKNEWHRFNAGLPQSPQISCVPFPRKPKSESLPNTLDARFNALSPLDRKGGSRDRVLEKDNSVFFIQTDILDSIP